MTHFLLGFVWGLTISAINEGLMHRVFLRGTSFIHYYAFVLRIIFDVLAMIIAWRFGNIALLGTVTGLLSLYPLIIWRAWQN